MPPCSCLMPSPAARSSWHRRVSDCKQCGQRGGPLAFLSAGIFAHGIRYVYLEQLLNKVGMLPSPHLSCSLKRGLLSLPERHSAATETQSTNQEALASS